MEFIEKLDELENWEGACETFKVKVVHPQVYEAVLVVYEVANPRHYYDISKKFQKIPWITDSNSSLAKVYMSFLHLGKFHVVYEVLESVELDPAQLETTWESLISGLKSLHKQGILHGRVKNILSNKGTVKLPDYSLPKPRSFEPTPELSFGQEYQNLAVALLEKCFKTKCNSEFLDRLANDYQDHQIIQEIIQVAKFPESVTPLPKPSANSNLFEVPNTAEPGLWFTKNSKLMHYKHTLKPYQKVNLGKGHSIASGNNCLILTGGLNTPNLALKFEFETASLTRLPDTQFKHLDHTSIHFRGEVWVIGGTDCPYVESWDGSTWKPQPTLNKPRNFVSACVSDTLYVISEGIEKLETAWVELNISVPWVGVMATFPEENKLLLLGGKTHTTYNSKKIIIDLTSGTQTEEPGVTGIFHSFEKAVIEDELYSASLAGKVFKLDSSNYLTSCSV